MHRKKSVLWQNVFVITNIFLKFIQSVFSKKKSDKTDLPLAVYKYSLKNIRWINANKILQKLKSNAVVNMKKKQHKIDILTFLHVCSHDKHKDNCNYSENQQNTRSWLNCQYCPYL